MRSGSLNENGKMHADPIDKTNIPNRQYESVYTHEDTFTIPNPSGQPYVSMEEIIVTKEGVKNFSECLTQIKLVAQT